MGRVRGRRLQHEVVSMTEDETPEARGEQGVEEQASEAPAAESGRGQMEAEAPSAEKAAAPDVYQVLRVCIGLLIQQGWVHLGLQAYPGTTDISMDLAKAKVAIDSAAAVYEHLRPGAAPEEQRDLEMVLANLRVNFARRRRAGRKGVLAPPEERAKRPLHLHWQALRATIVHAKRPLDGGRDVAWLRRTRGSAAEAATATTLRRREGRRCRSKLRLRRS